MTTATTPLEKILSRLQDPVRDRDKGYLAFCPAHSDGKTMGRRSLTVSEEQPGGKVLLHCFAGCETSEIVALLGLKMRDLFPQAPETRTTSGRGEIVATFNYHDERGNVLFQVVRFAPKSFRQRRPDPGRDGEWIWNLQGVTPVLYRLPEVMAAVESGRTIYLVEGEKDADRLRESGLTATTAPMGAGKWHDRYADALAGAHVVVLPDNDAPGKQHAQRVARSLHGQAASVRILDLPGLKEKQDVSDWLSAGGSPDDLEALVAEAPEWDPPVADQEPGGGNGHKSFRPGYWLTDAGLAERMVEQHGPDLRYCHTHKRWYIWDGRRWRYDDTGEVWRRAKSAMIGLYEVAATVEDEGQRDAVIKAARRALSGSGQKSVVGLAQSESHVVVTPDELDSDPWLLTCLNGTLDLRTGELRPHRREDLITALAPVEYDPGAEAPTWTAFLGRIMDGDESLVRFLGRMAGYTLTADTREQCLFFLYGTGSNGKSTFLQALRSALGDYATTTPTETLLQQRNTQIPNDLAALAGKRFVIASEADAGRRMAETLVKQITGGDTISARFMRSEFFEFEPRFKVLLAANHKPVIRGTDHAIWRRIRLIPFTVTIPDEEQDKTLGERLEAELPGILAWAVRGCLEWLEGGLRPPDKVVAATAAYREEMDNLGPFLADCTVESPTGMVTVKALYDAYIKWCEVNGENGRDRLGKRIFGRQLEERGLDKVRSSGGVRTWLGIKLVAQQDDGEQMPMDGLGNAPPPDDDDDPF